MYCVLTSKTTEYYVDVWHNITELCLKLTGKNVWISLDNYIIFIYILKKVHTMLLKKFFQIEKWWPVNFIYAKIGLEKSKDIISY